MSTRPNLVIFADYTFRFMRHCSFLACSILTALVFLFSGTDSVAQMSYVLGDTSIVHRLDDDIQVFIDPTDSIDISEITSPAFQANFNPSKGNLTFGYLKATIWLKVTTKTTKPGTEWYINIPAPFLEFVDFYQLDRDGKWDHSEAGYYRAQSVRRISDTGHVLPLLFSDDLKSTVYIRIAGSSPKTFPLFVVEKAKFNSDVRWSDIGHGVFFGILFVMFFYNLFICVSLRSGNYLLYICTIVCTFLIFSSATGYGGKFLWPENPYMNFYAGRMSLGVLTVFLSIFTIRFLEVKRYSNAMYYILVALVPLGLIADVLIVTGIMSSAGNNLISISTLAYMTTGIVCRIRGNKTATYFIAAWTIYLFGGLLLTLRNSGVLNFNFWTTHFVEIGAAMETIIIAFALGDRYRRYKMEKEEAQALALQLQQETTEKLEIKVSERTEQLSKANEELHLTLLTNKRQTEIIENKNAELDAFFYRISHDLKGPVASMLGLSYLARDEVKDTQAREYMDMQHQQVERVNNIITGLINLTKLNHTDLRRERIDFNKMVDECIASFHSLANFTQIKFIKEIDPAVEFYSEWTLLNAVVQNLIENAIKYAGRKEPYVKVIVRDDEDILCIAVEDNGQGIPDAQQAKIFEMFYRATQEAQGTGLGLYILKRSVERLNGTVSLKSKLGAGSTFTVKLPYYERGQLIPDQGK